MFRRLCLLARTKCSKIFYVELRNSKTDTAVVLSQQLITAEDHKGGLESQVNRLQHKLKDINEEFKSRLQKYVKDIAVSVTWLQINCWLFDFKSAVLIVKYFQFCDAAEETFRL